MCQELLNEVRIAQGRGKTGGKADVASLATDDTSQVLLPGPPFVASEEDLIVENKIALFSVGYVLWTARRRYQGPRREPSEVKAP
jgi:hypothetical protein